MNHDFRFPTGIMGTCCLPWNREFILEEEIFRKSIRSILEHTPLIYIFGTAGEGYALSREEYTNIVSIFTDEMIKADADPIIGVIGTSLSEILKRIQIAIDLGADTFQISLPSWGTLSMKETADFFRNILPSFPDSKFIIYNMMRAGRILQPDEFKELSEAYPNLSGAKTPGDSIRYIDHLMSLKLPLRFFFTGPGYAYASMLGECGLLISLESCNWDAAGDYYRAGVDNDSENLLEMQMELGQLTRRLLSSVGDTGHIDGAYDKIFQKLHVPEFPLRLLPPYSYPPDSVFNSFKDILINEFPRWYTA